jgi:hypothetical protein
MVLSLLLNRSLNRSVYLQYVTTSLGNRPIEISETRTVGLCTFQTSQRDKVVKQLIIHDAQET